MSGSVFRSLEEARGHFGPCALAIGNFDGVHAGHTQLLREAVSSAQQNGVIPAALTFHPHPTAVVAPARTPAMICSLDERIRLILQTGVEQVMVLPFTPAVASMTPDEFARSVLVDALRTKIVLVGENFLFGRGQSGNCQTLQYLGEALGFEARFLKPVSVRGQVVSSSAVRRSLHSGNVSRAGRLLGRCFSVRAPVVSGEGIGSKQTVPTLNQAPVEGRIYPSGVYVTETVDTRSGQRWPSITNVGTRPTFSGSAMTIETYLLIPLEQSAPAEVDVRFLRYLREEKTFADPTALRAQILKDVGRAKRFWRLLERSNGKLHSLY